MKSLFRLSAGLILSVSVITSAAANDHKILGVIAMPRNETNDLTLKLPVCRVVKRIQLSAERGDIQLSGATVYFKASHGASSHIKAKETSPMTPIMMAPCRNSRNPVRYSFIAL